MFFLFDHRYNFIACLASVDNDNDIQRIAESYPDYIYFYAELDSDLRF